jgi:flagellar biosynthetic protein FliQ
MTINFVMELARDFLMTALMIAMPALVVSLVIGLLVGILQAVTSVQEQTLSFVPRLIAVGLVMLICLGWILQLAVDFTMRMLASAAGVVR